MICNKIFHGLLSYIMWYQGAIMAVGASKPTVIAGKDGFFSVKNKMLVSYSLAIKKIYLFCQSCKKRCI